MQRRRLLVAPCAALFAASGLRAARAWARTATEDSGQGSSQPAGSAAAQRSRDGRGGRFDDDLFTHLEGEWLLTRRIGDREARNTVSAAWVLQHQFLRLQMRDVATPSRYEADVYIGYSQAAGEYVAHWMDNFGGHFSGEGRGRRHGDSVEFRFAYASGPFFNTFTWDPLAGTWSCLLESVSASGERQVFARDTLVRRP